MSDNIFLSLIEQEGIPALAGKTFRCPCGRVHTIGTQKLVIGRGVIRQVLDSGLTGTPFIVADRNTWPLAPKEWEDLPHYLFQHENIEADEYSLGDLLIESQTREFDYMIALGSGNIGDCTRYLASALKKPFVNVTTAPSMDGAASRHSPLIHHKFKTTYTAHEPYAIYFDLDIMAEAPKAMIAAGLADIEGKHVATLDWYLGHLATDEAYCPQIRDLTMEAVRKCESAAEGLQEGASGEEHLQAVQTVAEALMLSSLAMQLNITSRPASGMEHLISHAWENYGIRRGIPAKLHGDKVGIGTLIACDVYRKFFLPEENAEHASEAVPLGKKALEYAAAHPETAGNPAIDHARLLEHWDELQSMAADLYAKKDHIARCIREAGGPLYPSELDITPEQVRYGFDHMTDGRPRVTIAHLIEDLHLEKEIFDPVCEAWSR